MVIAPACQAGDRGFNPRRSRYATPIGWGFFYRAVAQWLARSVRDREAGSSSLPSPNKSLYCIEIAYTFKQSLFEGLIC